MNAQFRLKTCDNTGEFVEERGVVDVRIEQLRVARMNLLA
jgi:hypothetical protein